MSEIYRKAVGESSIFLPLLGIQTGLTAAFFACICPNCKPGGILFVRDHTSIVIETFFLSGIIHSMKEFRLWQKLNRYMIYLNVVCAAYTTASRNLWKR